MSIMHLELFDKIVSTEELQSGKKALKKYTLAKSNYNVKEMLEESLKDFNSVEYLMVYNQMEFDWTTLDKEIDWRFFV